MAEDKHAGVHAASAKLQNGWPRLAGSALALEIGVDCIRPQSEGNQGKLSRDHAYLNAEVSRLEYGMITTYMRFSVKVFDLLLPSISMSPVFNHAVVLYYLHVVPYRTLL
ncbi:hypothetical protein BD310DRAFT_910357 [Dichomitus squalens]|uniref:Uncharacterized protein n=1 Tax=Dichomitus squalens TaxID=114155 RepID=A0A4Q9PB95_9APHY|nr:hypothetical protein BD310DRAFT_910357 [Dichomitus squalens]